MRAYNWGRLLLTILGIIVMGIVLDWLIPKPVNAAPARPAVVELGCSSYRVVCLYAVRRPDGTYSHMMVVSHKDTLVTEIK